MSEKLKLYLDQMLGVDVFNALRNEGYDVLQVQIPVKTVRMTSKYYKRLLLKIVFLLHLMTILAIGSCYRSANILVSFGLGFILQLRRLPPPPTKWGWKPYIISLLFTLHFLTLPPLTKWGKVGQMKGVL